MALDKITTAMITDDAVTAAKIPAGAIGSTEIAEGALSSSALQNTTSHTLSGTYAESRMYTSDAYVLGGDTTVNSNLVLSSVKGDDSDITLTDDGTTRTITGTGKLEGGSIVAKVNTDLTGMTGELANSVQDNITRLGTVTSGTFNGALNSTTFSGDAGKRTAKAWVNYSSHTGAIRNDFNVSSINDLNSGDFEVNFQTPMANANYSAQYTTEINTSWLDGVDAVYMTGSTASKLRAIHYENNSSQDTGYNMVTVHGD